MSDMDSKLTRIGVFYDGNYFRHVSNYYNYHHERRARLSIGGLHHFIRAEVAKNEGVDPRYCQIVDAHYFRGRLSANEAQDRNKLFADRVFDDVLMREGVVTHYLPVTPAGEKGIDVWLALEVLELSFYKRFNVSVLITGDRDFVPLVRKLNTLGTRVMLLGWSFEFMTDSGVKQHTETSQYLIEEVTYPVLMNDEIDDRTRKSDPLINGLFLPRRESRQPVVPMPAAAIQVAGQPAPDGTSSPAEVDRLSEDVSSGSILNLKEGYGFIRATDPGSPNLFFFHSDLVDVDFNDVEVGMAVTYRAGTNAKGPCAVDIRLVTASEVDQAPMPS